MGQINSERLQKRGSEGCNLWHRAAEFKVRQTTRITKYYNLLSQSGLSLCAIILILLLLFSYQLRGPCLYFFCYYFVPGEFASQEILVLKCGQQNDLTLVDKVDDELD
jgi:hypothetical protein